MAKKEENKKTKNTKNTRLSSVFLRMFLALFVCMVAVGIGNQANRYQELLEEKAALQSEIEAEQERKAEFEKRQDYYNSDVYIEQMAREYLGMVKPNEILYINRGE